MQTYANATCRNPTFGAKLPSDAKDGGERPEFI